jgi:hypothetical protein
MAKQLLRQLEATYLKAIRFDDNAYQAAAKLKANLTSNTKEVEDTP